MSVFFLPTVCIPSQSLHNYNSILICERAAYLVQYIRSSKDFAFPPLDALLPTLHQKNSQLWLTLEGIDLQWGQQTNKYLLYFPRSV